MPRLKDVLDAIMSDFYAARATSDLRAAELHEMYSENPLMAQFSIPSFKFRQLELEVPVFLSEIETPPAGPTDPPPPSELDPDTVLAHITDQLATQAKSDLAITLSKSEKSAFRDMALPMLQEMPPTALFDPALAEKLTLMAQAVINERATKTRDTAFRDWPAALTDSLIARFATRPKTPMAHLGTMVALQQGDGAKSDSGDASARTVMKLVIVEDSFRVETIPDEAPGTYRKVLVRD